MSGKMLNKIIISIIGVIGVVILLYYVIRSESLPPQGELTASSTDIGIESDMTYATTTISAPKGNILAEISDTDSKRELGLSYRASLDTDSGMFFVFDEPGSYLFWMKDMNFPIDIVWIDALKKVVSVDPDVSPDTYPDTFGSTEEVLYILELNAGDAEKFGITTGTILQF